MTTTMMTIFWVVVGVVLTVRVVVGVGLGKVGP